MPPLVCPQPGPHGAGRDCPLYGYRLSMPDRQLRWAVSADSREPRPTLADAVKADAAFGLFKAPSPVGRPPLPVPHEPVVIPVHRIDKGMQS